MPRHLALATRKQEQERACVNLHWRLNLKPRCHILINPRGCRRPDVVESRCAFSTVRPDTAASWPGDSPCAAVYLYRGDSDPGERTHFRSNPTFVEESATAEQQHDEDDYEQCSRVHFLSLCLASPGQTCSLTISRLPRDRMCTSGHFSSDRDESTIWPAQKRTVDPLRPPLASRLSVACRAPSSSSAS
jgi:hypothetical protein